MKQSNTPINTNTESQSQSTDSSVNMMTLLSSIQYSNPSDLSKFMEGLTPEQSVIILIAAANHSQSKGVFTLLESELISRSIKQLVQEP